jgi:hypothetical protein
MQINHGLFPELCRHVMHLLFEHSEHNFRCVLSRYYARIRNCSALDAISDLPSRSSLEEQSPVLPAGFDMMEVVLLVSGEVEDFRKLVEMEEYYCLAKVLFTEGRALVTPLASSIERCT